jgi:hypothetical protein
MTPIPTPPIIPPAPKPNTFRGVRDSLSPNQRLGLAIFCPVTAVLTITAVALTRRLRRS